jgi:hypothetical protein
MSLVLMLLRMQMRGTSITHDAHLSVGGWDSNPASHASVLQDSGAQRLLGAE